MMREKQTSARGLGSTRGEVIFLAPGDVSKGRVEPISWMRTCEAYAHRGFDVTLAALRIRRPDVIRADEVWRHFGVDECFHIVSLPTFLKADASVFNFRAGAGVAATAFAITSTARAFRTQRHVPIIHARAPVLLAPFVVASRALPRRRRSALVFETHTLPKRGNAWIVRAADLVIVNSAKLAEDVQSIFRMPATRILHAPLPPHNSIRRHLKPWAREQVGLDADTAIACYTGKMTREHNEFLLAAASVVSQRVRHFRMLLVGGNPDILAWTRSQIHALRLEDVVTVTGFVAPAHIELFQSAADVLVNRIPETTETISYATPAKLYEYQAAGRPIVAADFPLFEEVLGPNGDRAIRVVDPSPQAFADGIVEALTLPDRGKAMAERATEFVKNRTWDARAALILEALGV